MLRVLFSIIFIALILGKRIFRSLLGKTSRAMLEHGRNWSALFGPTFDIEALQNIAHNALETSEKKQLTKSLTIMSNPWAYGIIDNDTLITFFPFWKTEKYENFLIAQIREQPHTQKLEAIITVQHESGCVLNFFALDYATCKQHYIENEKRSINIVGFAYILEDFNISTLQKSMDNVHTGPERLQFSENFCFYAPDKKKDEISVISIIESVEKYVLAGQDGNKIVLRLTPDFVIDVFIANVNLKIDLIPGKHVNGLIWLLGSLEK